MASVKQVKGKMREVNRRVIEDFAAPFDIDALQNSGIVQIVEQAIHEAKSTSSRKQDPGYTPLVDIFLRWRATSTREIPDDRFRRQWIRSRFAEWLLYPGRSPDDLPKTRLVRGVVFTQLDVYRNLRGVSLADGATELCEYIIHQLQQADLW